MIPLTSRVIAYVLGFLYVMYAILAFAAFAVDVDTLEDTKSIPCPTGFSCKSTPYNTTAALLFIGGLFLLAYIAWEYFISKREKKVALPAEPVIVA
eukprot:NODE_4323_length_590_cov_349.391867_g3126_i0.p1 GENE.NODE_4323_length_590_cov_349.391867_g3126_i0~~NODE_4323_length_590_cov_349.391867_g3126_i0.p1  ORF type:complete len:96 (-),score=48.16 NODE_4323_length_590_cov_349.391867_g3126_i0:168-455(-)